MLWTISRTFIIICLGMMCAGPLAASTRMFITGGTEFSTEFNRAHPPQSALCFNLVADTPPFIRKYTALEFAFAYTGPYPHTPARPEVATGTSSLDDWPPPSSSYWDLRSRFSESLRIYAIGRRAPSHTPDGVEVAFGVGNHQIISRRVEKTYDNNGNRHLHPLSDWRISSEWRAELVARIILFPTQSSGPVLQLDAQCGFTRRYRGDGVFTGTEAASLALGWRFRI